MTSVSFVPCVTSNGGYLVTPLQSIRTNFAAFINRWRDQIVCTRPGDDDAPCGGRLQNHSQEKYVRLRCGQCRQNYGQDAAIALFTVFIDQHPEANPMEESIESLNIE